ncbi:MAG: phosphoribosylformylglycinamidine synthase [Nitrospirota bacterium]
MALVHLYRRPALTEAGKNALFMKFPELTDIESEFCHNVEVSEPLDARELGVLRWLLGEIFEPENFSDKSFLAGAGVIEVGPRLNFQTAWSTCAVSVCHAAGLGKVRRIERSRRYLLHGQGGAADAGTAERFAAAAHDRMTECPYPEPLVSFHTGVQPEPVTVVHLIEEGKQALEDLNRRMGLGLDAWDLEYYYNLFAREMRRNPTNVECFDLGQSNSEHSRHWFFKGRLVIDGSEMPQSLFEIIRAPYERNPGRSVIAFKDNASAIRGGTVRTILPERPGEPSPFRERALDCHITFTAETHNFPSGVAPFPGAETGTGGRIRDTQAVGRGGHVIAGTAAYAVGNLRIPGYELHWEDPSFLYPGNLASPLDIEIEASNGASDYGNKFGEPVIQGYTRSFGLRLPGGERREWVKPIMFTGGVGQVDAGHAGKRPPERGMLVTKVGGPAYRIGMGGGAASSMVQGENVEELDFNAVQRGDAEMEQKMNRVLRACIERGEHNPIVSIHDQGAGGNCNVLKELVEPAGARVDVRKILSGDPTLSVLELWGAEYQENDALLLRPEHAALFAALCRREKVPFSFVGEVTGDGRIVVEDTKQGTVAVDLELRKVLGEMPRKTFVIERQAPVLASLALPPEATPREALARVLRLLSVGSKRFLTNKVDRSVTGLIAQQQCVGPLGLTLADVAVVAQSHFGLTGAAISIGEQPIKGLIAPGPMARLSVAEALTNILWAEVTALEDIRCSANWMWAAKLPGEGALIHDAAAAMSELMTELGISVDGGKDSLSMAALVREGAETVKAPGALVVSAYAPVTDVTKTVTPDLKGGPGGGESSLLYVDLGGGRYRLGGSALAQVYGQVGEESPDVEDARLLRGAFRAVQALIRDGRIRAGHDRSDGGLATALLEMAFAGNRGFAVDIKAEAPLLEVLFAEEAGLLVECDPGDEHRVLAAFGQQGVPCALIGRTRAKKTVSISVNGKEVLSGDMLPLRALWEETSYQLERLQANPRCAEEEKESIYDRSAPAFALTFEPRPTGEGQEEAGLKATGRRPRVAVVREEGSNGDRVSLNAFRGVAFVGGFSYADVLDSAKGWAGAIRFNDRLREEFDAFYRREDTFSLGVCNGCQLMALLGWVPWSGLEGTEQPRFVRNRSGRFESRFSTVQILESPSIMLRGMEGSVLGIWVAHGEGRALFPHGKVYEKVLRDGLAPVRFADDRGRATERYPFNPNGSPEGIAALCSPDGRHLAMMPHPERSFLLWQWPWVPPEWQGSLTASPWLRLFQNARHWCGDQSPF